jgi:hypothetical protein
MTISELNKFKKELEKKLKGVITKAKDEGIDTTSLDFRYKLDKVKKQLITSSGIDPDEYDTAEAELIEELEGDIRDAKILIHTKTKKQPISWDEIQDKPRFFSQEDIQDLPFSQLSHKDADHPGIINSIRELTIDSLDIKGDVSTQRKDINSILNKKEDPLSHDELLSISPDQHHKEKHDLESHIESKLKTQLERMVSGEYVDDLHKHFIDKTELPRIIDIAGITKNDADLLYLGITSSVPLTLPDISGNGSKVISVKSDASGFEYTANLSTDEKVKLSASDPIAGYLDAKLVESGTVLLLNQTTPQTITNGIPLLTGLTPTTDYQIATKKYVDDSVLSENLWDRTGTTLTPHTAGDNILFTGTLGAGAITGTSLDAGSGAITTTGKVSYCEADWTGGNVIYVPIGSSINTAVVNATAGDTLILGAGTYALDATIACNKSIRIIGQGMGRTNITYTEANAVAFAVTASDVYISDLSISVTSRSTSGYGVNVNISAVAPITNIRLKNLDITMTSTSSSTWGVRWADVTLGYIDNVRINSVSSGATANYGINITATAVSASTTSYINNCDVYVSGTPAARGYYFAGSVTSERYITNSKAKALNGSTASYAFHNNSPTTNTYAYNNMFDGTTADMYGDAGVIYSYNNYLVNNLILYSTIANIVHAKSYSGDLEVRKDTGTATLSPVTLTLKSMKSASDWDIANNWANVDFYSMDASGPGASVRGRIGARFESTAGSLTSLVFQPSNVTGLFDAMTINSSGNVGVGGSIASFVTAPDKWMNLYSSTDGHELAYGLYAYEGTNNRRVKLFLDDTTGQWGFDTSAATGIADFVIQRAGVTQFFIGTKDAGSNVGIGTTAPGSKLHVAAGNIQLDDYYKTLYGNAKDATIYYDSTNLIINPKEVGSGYLNIKGQTLVDDKIIFTQTDGNEYIDSLADGYLDYGATTAHRFNNPLILSNVKSGATQAGASAVAGEVWKTSGHATLPDNVLMIGV